jgi:hypothetical protein
MGEEELKESPLSFDKIREKVKNGVAIVSQFSKDRYTDDTIKRIIDQNGHIRLDYKDRTCASGCIDIGDIFTTLSGKSERSYFALLDSVAWSEEEDKVLILDGNEYGILRPEKPPGFTVWGMGKGDTFSIWRDVHTIESITAL